MSRPWPLVPLGEVATSIERAEIPVPGKTYRQIGVRLWGRGAYEREPMDGAETKYATLSRVKAGDIIVNKIWARNGSVAVVPEGLAGCYGSGEFPTFEPIREKIDARWVHWATKTTWFWRQCDEKSQGTSGKNRIRPERFLQIQLPLPPLAEQRRLVAKIEALAGKIEEAKRLRAQASEETALLKANAVKAAFQKQGETCVGDFTTIQSGYAFKSQWFTEDGIRLVRNVNIGHGHITWSQVARIPEPRREEFVRFDLKEADILISLDRPIISTGVKVARVRQQDLPSLLLQRVGRVCFNGDAVLPDYFFAWLRSPHFVSALDPGRSNGVPHISPSDVERIPFAPPAIAKQRRVIDYLAALEDRVTGLGQRQAEGAAELDALLPAVLDKAFKGEL